MRNGLVVVLGIALLSLLAPESHAANVRQDVYEVTVGASATTGSVSANFAGYAKRAYVASQDLGTTCVVALRSSVHGTTLFASDALSTGTTTVSMGDLPVAERTEWLVTTGASPATTSTVSIRFCYDANQ